MFKTKEDANKAIKFGLLVESKKVYGGKLIPEPTRNKTFAEHAKTHTEPQHAQSW
ncbi:hypothetical protein BDR04DRAFT_1153693 [Suillus decipiens]|nr:hypothetical protein BDR04DRAFT_1153693 [Suillus decipiens]